jgi:hypothetical protein
MEPREEDSRLTLSAEALQEAQQAHTSAVDEFLAPENQLPNVVGLGVGVKFRGGEPTGEQAVQVLVNQKVAPEVLPQAAQVPGELAGVQTDVIDIGVPLALGHAPVEAATQTLARRVRPAQGGYSVGHPAITAGTIGTCVYDILPEGIGSPRRYYILSNNHVLANSNAAIPGDAALQPGPADGGVDPADRIARLSHFVPITFEPPVPRAQHRNLVDCAVAEGAFHDLNREIYWIGYVRGWRERARVTVGTRVQKTGRTTNYTIGTITTVNATVDVNYGGPPPQPGRIARLIDQILTTPMSAGGDSGSLVTTLDDVAVGLLFAGSPVVTILNQIENVRSLLRVEVAEERL